VNGEFDPADAALLADLHAALAEVYRGVAEKTSGSSLAAPRAGEQLSTVMPATQTSAPGRQLLSQKALADRLDCDVRTLRRWTHLGEVPAPIMIGGAKRWDPDDVDRWLASRQDGARGRASARVSAAHGDGRRNGRGGPP
jgi:predicted DNA-binding transcriptional regulator AlpA